MDTSSTLAAYYAARAPEYDRIYERPERQADLASLRQIVRETFSGMDVLEIACGTGYWTEILAEVSRSLTAVDINESVLEIARIRRGADRVQFVKADAYTLPDLPAASACLCAFWWSHVPKAQLSRFLEGLQRRLTPGAIVLFTDNRYVEGNSTPVSRPDGDGNTYQTRKLEDGSTHEVIKNFPNEPELERVAAPFGEGAIVRWLTFYWTLTYRTKQKRCELPAIKKPRLCG